MKSLSIRPRANAKAQIRGVRDMAPVLCCRAALGILLVGAALCHPPTRPGESRRPPGKTCFAPSSPPSRPQFPNDLDPAKLGVIRTVIGGPLKPAFLDEDRPPVKVGPEAWTPVREEITGRKKDQIKLVVKLPDATTLKQVKRLRVERASATIE